MFCTCRAAGKKCTTKPLRLKCGLFLSALILTEVALLLWPEMASRLPPPPTTSPAERSMLCCGWRGSCYYSSLIWLRLKRLLYFPGIKPWASCMDGEVRLKRSCYIFIIITGSINGTPGDLIIIRLFSTPGLVHHVCNEPHWIICWSFNCLMLLFTGTAARSTLICKEIIYTINV